MKIRGCLVREAAEFELIKLRAREDGLFHKSDVSFVHDIINEWPLCPHERHSPRIISPGLLTWSNALQRPAPNRRIYRVVPRLQRGTLPRAM